MDDTSPPKDFCQQLAGMHINLAPTTSAPALIVTACTQYPILEALLPHLNTYDFRSLRSACKALRTISPNHARLLGGTCQSKVIYWDDRCQYPQYNKPLSRCPGYAEEGLEPLESTGTGSASEHSPPERKLARIHKKPFWTCSNCVACAAYSSINTIIGRDLDTYRIRDSQHMGRFVPICTGCFTSVRVKRRGALLRATLENASIKLKDCSCIASFKAEVMSKNFCLDCAKEVFMRGVKEDIDRGLGRYQHLVATKNGPGFLCGKCEETITAPEELQRPRIYLCVSCEDIAIPSLPYN